MKWFFILCGLTLGSSLLAQPYERLFSPAGGSWNSTSFVQVAIGEPITGTLRATDVVATQGFLQVFKMTTSTRDQIDQGVRVDLYPNPSDGRITLRHSLPSDQPYRIRVFSLLGQMVYNGKAVGPCSLDLAHLANGMYVLQLEQNQKTYSIKFEKH